MAAPKLTQHQKNEIVAKVLSGGKLTQIAEEYGCDPTYPGRLARRYWLKAEGTLPMGKGQHWSKTTSTAR